MEPLVLALLATMALAVVALILAERGGSRAGMWVAKPLASAAFVAIAVVPQSGSETAMSADFAGLAWSTIDGRLFVALALAFLGDLCLIPADRRIFRAGVLLFLLAHVAFGAAFLALGVSWGLAALALMPLVAAAILVARWILPGVPSELKGAVVAYVVVITGMVALAAGTSWTILAAALAFWTNDILVARDRFVQRSWLNRAVGLPLYYGAMAMFALFARGTLP